MKKGTACTEEGRIDERFQNVKERHGIAMQILIKQIFSLLLDSPLTLENERWILSLKEDVQQLLPGESSVETKN